MSTRTQSAQQDPGKNGDGASWVAIERIIRDVSARQHVSLLSYFVSVKG